MAELAEPQKELNPALEEETVSPMEGSLEKLQKE